MILIIAKAIDNDNRSDCKTVLVWITRNNRYVAASQERENRVVKYINSGYYRRVAENGVRKELNNEWGWIQSKEQFRSELKPMERQDETNPFSLTTNNTESLAYLACFFVLFFDIAFYVELNEKYWRHWPITTIAIEKNCIFSKILFCWAIYVYRWNI